MAAVPQPADLRRLRGVDLRHRVAAVLVHRPDTGPRHDARQGEDPRVAGRLRLPVARLAGLDPSLEQLRERLPAARRPGDAAGAVGAHRGVLRLLDRHHPRLAFDDLPALLRGWRDLRRLRHGADLAAAAARRLRPPRHGHRAPSPCDGQGDAGHRVDRLLRLPDRDLLRLVQRQRLRVVHDEDPHLRSLPLVLAVADRLQRPHPAAAVEEERALQRGRALADLYGDQRRHVAGAVRHHHHQPAPGVPALRVGHVPRHGLGLDDVRRHARPVPLPDAAVRPLPADDRHVRGAHPDPRQRQPRVGGGASMRPEASAIDFDDNAPPGSGAPLYGVMAEFATPDELLAAAHAAREAGYKRVDAYTPYPMEAMVEALEGPRSQMPLVVLGGGITGGLTGFFLACVTPVFLYPSNTGGPPHHSAPASITPTTHDPL